MPYDISDSVPIAWNVQDASGNPVTAGAVTLTITLPDGTTTSPSVPAPTTTGQYRVTYVPTLDGRYTWRAVTTTPTTAYGDVFTVRASASTALLSLADTKTQLKITSASFDDELREFIEAATEIVESYVGPVVTRTHTARVSGYRCDIALPHTQVQSITSITVVQDGSTPITLSDLTINTPAGIVSYKSGAQFPYAELDITYVVGRTSIKANWTSAAKIIVQHNWRSKLGNQPSAQGDDHGYVVTGSGYQVPYQALGLLQSDHVPAGFA